jgi:hypothetical protein
LFTPAWLDVRHALNERKCSEFLDNQGPHQPKTFLESAVGLIFSHHRQCHASTPPLVSLFHGCWGMGDPLDQNIPDPKRSMCCITSRRGFTADIVSSGMVLLVGAVEVHS